MTASLLCGKTYGTKRHKQTCKRLAGHKGTHSQRRKPEEMAYLLGLRAKPPAYATPRSGRTTEGCPTCGRPEDEHNAAQAYRCLEAVAEAARSGRPT